MNCALVWRVFEPKPVLALVAQFKLSPLVLAGFSALAPEPQQIGAYLPIHTRPWKPINRLISYTIQGRPWNKRGSNHLKGEEKKKKNCKEIIFSFRGLAGVKAFPGPSEVT